MSDLDKMRFTGSIPENYDRHMGPIIFEPYAQDVASRLSHVRHGRVLELACGTGIVTKELRATLPTEVELVATDLSPDMQAIAKAKLAGEAIEWNLVDAGAIPYPDASFDAVVFQFGLMFMPDPSLAVHEIRRVLKHGGIGLVYVWDKVELNGWVHQVSNVIKSLFPETGGKMFAVPFSMNDPEQLKSLFVGSFPNVRVTKVEKSVEILNIDSAVRALVLGTPLFLFLQENRPDDIPQIIENLKAKVGPPPIKNDMSAILIELNP